MKRFVGVASSLLLALLLGQSQVQGQVTRPGGGGGLIGPATPTTFSLGCVVFSNGGLLSCAAPGAAGTVMTSNGAGVAPTFQASAGGPWGLAGNVISPNVAGNIVQVGDGGVNPAAYGFTNETTLGLFRRGAGQLGITAATTIGWFDTAGLFLLGTRLESYTSGIGSTSTDGMVNENVGAALAGAQQWSPRLRFTGFGWQTNAGGASTEVDWIAENIPVQGTAAPTSNFTLSSKIGAGSYNKRWAFLSGGDLQPSTDLVSSIGDTTHHMIGTHTRYLYLGTVSDAIASRLGTGQIQVGTAVDTADGQVKTAQFLNGAVTTVAAPGFALDVNNRGIYSDNTGIRFSDTGVDAGRVRVASSSNWFENMKDLGGFAIGATPDTFLTRGGAPATLQAGGAPSGSPIAQRFQGPASRVGVDTNTAGGNLTLAPGLGTGSATGSSLVLSLPYAGSTGTAVQSELATTIAATSAQTSFSSPQKFLFQPVGFTGAVGINLTTTGSVPMVSVSDGTSDNAVSSSKVSLQSNGIVTWTSGASSQTGQNTGLSRVRSGVVGVGDSTVGSTVGWILSTRANSFVSTQFDKTSSTALAAITGLTTTLDAAKTYAFVVTLHVTAGTVGGATYDMGGGTATATTFISQVNVLADTTNVFSETSRQTTLTGASAGVAGDTAYFIKIEGTIVVNGAGTFIPRFAQKVSNGTASSVLVGSNMLVTVMT